MMDILLNVMNAISASWVWLGPLLVICIGVILVDGIVEVFRGIREEMEL